MRYKIAIIDDEEKILSSLQRYFSLKNFDVETFSDPLQALSAIRRQHIKVVLTDINMPGLDGLQLLSRLKKINPLIQVVIMTGNATAETVRESIQNGAAGFIVKPFDSLQMVESLVEKAVGIVEKKLMGRHGS